jgi:hypothetical protein
MAADAKLGFIPMLIFTPLLSLFPCDMNNFYSFIMSLINCLLQEKSTHAKSSN